MNDWKIPLYKIYTDDEDVNLITKILKRGERWAIGPEIEEFEELLKNFVGCDYCVSLNSGTSALHATLLAYDIEKNNEVIIPSFSFIATANSVVFTGAKPVFSDIEEKTYGLDPEQISSKVSSRTKAVMPMDYGGLPCKIREINEIVKKENLLLIEDAAEALGSSINGKKTGSIADASIFSFCGNKVLTTGEGGAIVTNSKELYEKIKLIRSHGRLDKINYFENSEGSSYHGVGYNWRMSSITASLGISQLHKIEKLIKKRQENANFISSRLSKYSDIKVPVAPSGYDHIYQMYSILLSDQNIRDELHIHLTKKRIFSKIYFNPIHLLPFYQENHFAEHGSLPITEKISNQILTLPLYPNMTSDEKNYLVESIKEFFEKKGET